MRLRHGLVVAVVAAAALGLRLLELDRRPMHGDEANQAHRTGVLFERGHYRYDPEEHHGPSLYYFTLPSLWVSGASSYADTTERSYRIVPVLFGAALILLMLLAADGLSPGATVVAAALTAISPAMVFYSRYYIQETLLVFFSFAAIAAGWRYTQSKRLGWALAAGASLGLMHATKETCLLAYAAMGLALLLVVGWTVFGGKKPVSLRTCMNWRHLIVGAIAAGVISGLFFSSFLTNLIGPLDSIRAYFTYFDRAAFAPDRAGGIHLHRHPWHFFLQLLLYTKRAPGPWWSEGLIVALALVGAGFALLRKPLDNQSPHLVRFLAFYTIGLTVFYSAIPYKTPWCMMGFLHGMILLAGVGVAGLFGAVKNQPGRFALAVLLAAAAVHLGLQTWRANFVYYADPRNPYVYAHTSTSLVRLAGRVEDIARVDPEGANLLVRVIEPQGDYWPLPWYLRRLKRVGYWTGVPDTADAAVIVIPPRLREALEAKLKDSYHVEYYSLRPGVLRLAYIRTDLWESFLETRQSASGL